ncbi:lingual antimicrobial peptide-like [Pelodiscus sinensis]|uniref:lingual antimicrobial peptide-like n=1 Tax=Pelodiscus sinensis TaxID=13735 RepID=UPI0003C47537|nr:lingual antimicrobial peptide-like isoform X1 [Pelodiscus sinensis]|eukprot:XP_006127560.1 lingual antimicrobial peptide-like isoform X1 [Pelodiscus sinensis]
MKILHLLFAVFFLLLQSSPGYTQFVSDPYACRRARGFCRSRCYPQFLTIGTCGFAQSCCKRRRLGYRDGRPMFRSQTHFLPESDQGVSEGSGDN